MHWIDWYGEHWLVVPLVLLGLAFVLVRTALWTRRRLERGRRKRVARKAAKAEESALTLLEKHGYEVLETQVEQQWEVDYGSDNLAVQLRVDATVRRDGRDFIAEVKSGQLVASLRHAPTRRQLLEYAVAYNASGVLLVDMQRRRIDEIGFPQLARVQACASQACASQPRYLWRVLAAVFVAFAAGTAVGSLQINVPL